MKNTKNPTDAEVRKDFEGGWKGDKQNKFTASGRNPKENEAFELVKKLANYRKNTPTLHSGKFTQYLPQDGVYVYFRYDNAKTIMVDMNTNATESAFDTARFSERMKGFSSVQNILNGETVSGLSSMKVPPMSAWVLELK